MVYVMGAQCNGVFAPAVRIVRDEPSTFNRPIIDEGPPFLRTWRRVYVLILGYLAAVIFGLYLFGRAFA